MSTRLERRVVAKTAAYTIKPPMDSPGTVFTNRGAGAGVTFTLPKATAAVKGHWYHFKAVVAFAVTVTGAAADSLITLNDAAATSVAAATIGADIEAVCDGTSWFVNGVAVGHTYTVTA